MRSRRPGPRAGGRHTLTEYASRVAVYCPDLGGGVAQIALAQIDILLAAGYPVDLLIQQACGHYSERIPERVRVVPLAPADEATTRACRDRALRGHPIMRFRSRFVSANRLTELSYVPALVDYLERERPALLLANVWSSVLIAGYARACIDYPPRLIGLFHGTFFAEAVQRRSARRHPLRWRHFFALCRSFYSRADALITVSDGVGRDLVRIVGVAAHRVETLSNPVVSAALIERAAEPVTHPWFEDVAPLVVAVGRLSPEKNYRLLIEAFAHLRAARADVRLAILGEGQERVALEALRDELGLSECVTLPGWVDNPHAWMARASLLTLSSDWEGLPTVLIEAMACGCPVVATDCMHGPREIVDHGRYGRLVPVGDVQAFARAMAETIDAPHASDLLRTRAEHYSIAAATQRYRALVARVLAMQE
ncbi:glycosyltransferase [Endozoicomonas sp. G2_2]|uniref:glycosyltransferase n=1 Tax=Endozoicomonas sp. G2_2 TaxID=2821092 RepID=UPI0032AFA32D